MRRWHVDNRTLAQRLWEADPTAPALKTPIAPQSVDDLLAFQRCHIVPIAHTPLLFYVAVAVLATVAVIGVLALVVVLL
jgi:hypothetical protein